MTSYYLAKNTGTVPEQAVVMGRQSDAGDMHVGLAQTQFGDIPGKVKGTRCWYSYAGKEHITDQFKWLVAPHYALELKANDGNGPPRGALGVGIQHDSGVYYMAVANAGPQGTIPGKAQGSTCWYPYGDKELHTGSFHWIVERGVQT